MVSIWQFETKNTEEEVLKLRDYFFEAMPMTNGVLTEAMCDKVTAL